MRLQNGTELLTEEGKRLLVLNPVETGSSCTVYQAVMDGMDMRLYWFEATDPIHDEPLIARISALCRIPRPSTRFFPTHALLNSRITWGGYGYVQPSPPKGFIPVSGLTRTRNFDSPQAKYDAMIDLVLAFHERHAQGRFFRCLRDSDVWIHPSTGKLMINDFDALNVPDKDPSRTDDLRFLAPEIIVSGQGAGMNTDRHLLAVLLFEMACQCHPFEGRLAAGPVLGPEECRTLYGSNPVFLFDPDDESNRPVRGINGGAILEWPRMPVALQRIFEQAFTHSMKSSGGSMILRPSEQLWMKTLLQIRTGLVTCRCGQAYLLRKERGVCPKCGLPAQPIRYIRTTEGDIPAVPGVRIFWLQLKSGESDIDAFRQIAEVINVSGDTGIRNVSSEAWQCTTSQGARKVLPLNEVMPAKPGIRVAIRDARFEIAATSSV